jgi:hypothetical protein
VQQPCSNPSESPAMLGNARSEKYADLQGFCKLQKASAMCRFSLTRRRSLVRTQHRPLRKNGVLQVKCDSGWEGRELLSDPSSPSPNGFRHLKGSYGDFRGDTGLQAVSIARTISLGSSGRTNTSRAMSKLQPSLLRFFSSTPRPPSPDTLRELEFFF